MTPLIQRELRRIAPLALLSTLIATLALGLAHARELERGLALTITAGAAALLGVSTVAPDVASGRMTFLRLLPLPAWRLGSAKLTAATLATLPLTALATLTLPHPLTPLLPLSGLACGLAASTIAPKTLPAITLAPLLGAGYAAIVFVTGALAWGLAPQGIYLTLSVVGLGLALALAAVGAFLLGDPHRPLRHPAIILAALALPALSLQLGITRTAWGITISRDLPNLPINGPASITSTRLAIPLSGPLWTGDEHRVALIDPRTHQTWVPNVRDVHNPSLSPDGQHALLRPTPDAFPEHGGYWVEIASRTIHPLITSPPGWTHCVTPLWTPHGPLLAGHDGDAYRLFDPRPLTAHGDPVPPHSHARKVRRPLPPGERLLGFHGHRAWVAHHDGISSITLPDPHHTYPLESPGHALTDHLPLSGVRTQHTSWPSNPRREVVLSWDGHALLVRDQTPDPWTLIRLDTDAPPLQLPDSQDLRPGTAHREASLAPGGTALAIGDGIGRFAVFDLRTTPTRHDIQGPPTGPNYEGPTHRALRWSSPTTGTLPWAATYHLDAGLQPLPQPAAALLDGTPLLFDHPIALDPTQ